MSNQQPQDKRTASQKIDDLERGIMAMYHTADSMARDINTLKEALKLLGNKMESVVQLLNKAGSALSDEAISTQMVENNVDELKQKVSDFIAQGVLVPAEEVGPNSFVVGRELDENGKIQNPRMQFIVSGLNPEVKGKFPGAKVGQLLELQEGKWKFEIQETYDIAQAPAAPAPADNQAALEQKIEAQVAAPASSETAPTES